MSEADQRRFLIQYLEPSPAVGAIEPTTARDRLVQAFDRLPVTDVAFGWDLRPDVAEAVRTVVPSDVTVWRWVPLFTDSGEEQPTDLMAALGPEAQAPPAFRDMADFRFLCLDRHEVVEAAGQRARRLAMEIDADGVLLDRIRFHSPGASPVDELTCFCPYSDRAAARDGLDLAPVRRATLEARATLAGRRALVATLLGRTEVASVGEFLGWREDVVTRSVSAVTTDLGSVGLRAALDVFTPALTRSVGQDLAALGSLGEWSKSMTYFEALGPASMPFELTGYVEWLSAAGDDEAASFVSDVVGFALPRLSGFGPQLASLAHEARGLAAAVGPKRAIVGIDAVQVPGVCEVDDDDLSARLRQLRVSGLGASPCWELLLMDDARVGQIARAWAAEPNDPIVDR